MKTLDEKMQQREAGFIATVEDIIKQQDCSNRTKAAMIHRQYIKCLVAIEDLVSEAKLETPPGGAVSSN